MPYAGLLWSPKIIGHEESHSTGRNCSELFSTFVVSKEKLQFIYFS